ncbi:hypothetical protein FLAG1_09687 [Fusarium langsethiae]|uniref:CBM-cenC domain-containing protein n=1 Tax=Fusarium langsethiae TaxID=179993 RepID=A0A0M9EPZ1_FUSLA|nr:hypothetical protein FLAG1_09687 [Fusarium langsethiae]GKU06562.1 unnamed protein product [Fusarium langsethiae]GKU12015.1 unnamed protein product [Fusarium langsethiae]
MVRFSVLPAAAVALFLSGAEAGPCRPSTTGVTSLAESSSTIASDSTATSVDSTAPTTLTDTTTTVQAESTATATETSLAETLSTIASDTTIASVGVTTTTTHEDPTTTAQAESTTTTVASSCVETQLFVNPGFDDSATDVTPWTNNGAITQNSPQSGTNAVAYTLSGVGYHSGSVAQTLSNLEGTYEFSYNYRVTYISPGADHVCEMKLSVGDTTVYGAFDDRVGGWKSGSVIFTDVNTAQADVQLTAGCYGEYNQIQVNIDTLGFTRVCGE